MLVASQKKLSGRHRTIQTVDDHLRVSRATTASERDAWVFQNISTVLAGLGSMSNSDAHALADLTQRRNDGSFTKDR